jgi:hypothetical protein
MPAKPEETRSERDQRHVMRPVRDLLAATYIEHRCERCESGRIVHNDTAGEVKNTLFWMSRSAPAAPRSLATVENRANIGVRLAISDKILALADLRGGRSSTSSCCPQSEVVSGETELRR